MSDIYLKNYNVDNSNGKHVSRIITSLTQKELEVVTFDQLKVIVKQKLTERPVMTINQKITDHGLTAPLTNLPSFLITTIMLSYYGHTGEVFKLLLALSHSTRAYFIIHRP